MKPFSAIQSSSGSLFSAYAELAAYRMLLKTVIDDVIPVSVRSRVWPLICSYIFKPPTKLTTIVIEEQSGMTRNAVFDSAEIYLSTKLSPNADRFKVSQTPKQKSISITMEKGQLITDTFRDVINMEWRFVSVQNENNYHRPESRHFELSFEKQHRDVVVDEYLPFVLNRADEIKNSDKAVRLYSMDCAYRDDDDCGGNSQWGSVKLDHPSTFDKIAMEPEKKKALIEDLDRFLRRKDYYRQVGKAWKRGYLLYGPPGTGKSSLIAAIANYLKFDVYDLELAMLHSDTDLKRIMLSTTNRSIIVIEDIDCSAETHDRGQGYGYYPPPQPSSQTFTLSGLLNFIDGLWSCCGDERIIIFTTNHKDKLDPALLRPGRMDMHVHLSYCTPAGFRTLASNYQGVDREHNEGLFDEIEGLIESCEVTPAVIAEELMRSEDADAALEGVKTLLTQKLAEKNAAAELKDFEEEEEEEGGGGGGGGGEGEDFEEVGRKRRSAVGRRRGKQRRIRSPPIIQP